MPTQPHGDSKEEASYALDQGGNMQVNEADVIRNHVVQTKFQPIKRLASPKRTSVTIRSIDIAKELSLEYNMPNVCGALDRKMFLAQNNVFLKSRIGPKAGRTVVWEFLV
jgi:hypothetical protein